MTSSISVKDVFTKTFSTVYENDALSSCLDLFKKETPPVLAVLDDKGKYAGVIARRWITRSRPDPTTTKVKTLTRPAPCVQQQTKRFSSLKAKHSTGALLSL
jgi:predicted transcriptional regulator